MRRSETCFATTETNVAFCSRFSVCAYNSHQDTSMNCRYRCRCNPNRTCEHKATSPASHKFCCTVDRAETFADSPKTLSCLWLFSSCPMTTESGQQQLEPQQWTGSAYWFVCSCGGWNFWRDTEFETTLKIGAHITSFGGDSLMVTIVCDQYLSTGLLTTVDPFGIDNGSSGGNR